MAKNSLHGRWTPEFILDIVKGTLGCGKLDKEECGPDKIVVEISKRKTYSVRPSFLARKEATLGIGAAIQTIVRNLKAFDENASFDTTVEEEAKDKGKRKLSAKAEAVDQALDMAGSSKKEKDEILKNA